MNKNLFSQIELTKPGKNVFDLTHDMKFSMRMGDLVPVCAMETVPGDKFQIGAESLIRLAPLVAPVMHRLDAYIHYFFVPNRILWDGWEKWIVNPSASLLHPHSLMTAARAGLPLSDYLGIPPHDVNQTNNTLVNALPFAAYQAIYSNYYRDQNLIPEFEYKLTDGEQLSPRQDELYTMRKRAWEHDYFTASLPFAQKGAPVSLPLGDVKLKDDFPLNRPRIRTLNGVEIPNITNLGTNGVSDFINNNAAPVVFDPSGTLEVAPTTVNDLRRAYKLQEWLERNARAGTRYIENILAHFGVRSSDARLQRPEYITGVKTPIVISEVLNTTGFEIPQGNMAGHGIAVLSTGNKPYFCQEHGWIIGIMSILPKPAYQQGLEKKWLKFRDPFQYFWPSFAHIGEQPVEVQEIYAHTTTGSNTFGYVPRYSEYKYAPSRVAGDFRTSLKHWHIGRIFANEPALNKEFVECNPREDIFAVVDPNEDKFYCHVLNKVRAIRPMPFFGTPSM